MKIEVSIGEIVDKLSILEIKKDKIKDVDKLTNITTEYNYLNNIVYNELNINKSDYNSLLEINSQLWNVEDEIRVKERTELFDSEFIYLARSVYILNDKRFKLKQNINIKYNSSFKEEKSY